MCLCMYSCTYMYVYICVCMCIYVFVCMCLCVCVCVCVYFVNSTWLILQLIYGDVRFRWFVDDVPQDSHEQVLNVNFATIQRYVLIYAYLLRKHNIMYVYVCMCVLSCVPPMYVCICYVCTYIPNALMSSIYKTTKLVFKT